MNAAPAVPVPAAALGALLALPWLWPWAPGPSVQALPLLVAWACGVLAALACLWSPRLRAAAPLAVAGAWLVAAAGSAVAGLLQWFGLQHLVPGVPASDLGQAYGMLRQRNQLATLLSIGLASALCLAAWRRPRPAARLLLAAAVALIALGSAATLSRTGLLQLLAVCGVALFRPATRRLACLALASYAAGALGLSPALQALYGAEVETVWGRLAREYGCSSRRVLWANVLHLIAQRPWAGWGLGELDYAHFATLYPGARFCDILDNAHNLPLHLAVELGIPLALGACVAVVALVWRAAPWRERVPFRVLAWAVLGVIALHSGLEYPLWYGPFQLAVLLALALLVAVPARDAGDDGPDASATGDPDAAEPAPVRWRRAGTLAGVGALAVLGWAAWCYLQVSQAYLPPEQRLAQWRIDPLHGIAPGPFRGQADFARLSLTPLTQANAAQQHALALRVLHVSPEPKVIEAAIASAVVLGRDDEALWLLARFRAAFPREHAAWSAANRAPAR